MRVKSVIIFALFFLGDKSFAQKSGDIQKTGVIGVELNIGRNSIYGTGGLSVLFRPFNAFELTLSTIDGKYEGIGYYSGIGAYILPYKMMIKDNTHHGLISINPFITFGFSSLNSNSFVNSSGPNLETSFYSPGNMYLPASTGIKVELLSLNGNNIQDHAFLNLALAYRYCITNNKIQYVSGYFNQIDIDSMNSKNLSPIGFSIGGGFYFRSFLRKRKLPI